tara:strand:- start:41 stop:205 length:165 start_codon:yes stop_codon:yes gene_type:complete
VTTIEDHLFFSLYQCLIVVIWMLGQIFLILVVEAYLVIEALIDHVVLQKLPQKE